MNPLWTRRTFLSTAGLAATATALPAAAAHAASASTLAFTAHDDLGHGTPGLRTHHRTRLPHTSDLPTTRILGPLALHPTLPMLYTASAATSTLPAVLLSFTIDPASITAPLRPRSQQPLSIATTTPRDLAVTPNGRHLLTIDHRGQLSLHPLAADGALLPLQHVRQLTGVSPRRLARPHSLLLRDHLAYVADPGTHRLVLVALAGPEPALLPSVDLPATISPGRLTLRSAGRLLAITSLITPTVALLPLDPVTALPDPARLRLRPSPHALSADAPATVFPA